jgi:ribose/xylose/arabinose/galactoside ABC-type transport system permease subunit/ABC-type multidrug transport system ATPase subunit
VLIMDEPTSSLTPHEVEELFAIVRQLRATGTAVVFISHRLEELFALADRVTTLRDGTYVGTRAMANVTTDELIRMMVGRSLGELFPKQEVPAGEVILDVAGLGVAGSFSDVSFQLHRGEILGMAGLIGAGRTNVARALFGTEPATSGTIRLDGKPVAITTPSTAMALGIGYVPEDRKEHGLVLEMGIGSNITLPVLRRFARGGWLNPRRERQAATEAATRLEVKMAAVDQQAGQLSGGNQQKVVLAKWLGAEPRVLILDEPTRGIDVGTKAAVHHLMGRLAAQGMAILMISSELPEVLGMSDRILVMREGRITGEFSRAEATPEGIMAAATGARAHDDDGAIAMNATTDPATRPRGSMIQAVVRLREAGIMLFMIVLSAGVSLRSPAFLTADNFNNILLNISILVIVALAQMMVIITRGIDLSVGSMIGLTAMMVAFTITAVPGLPFPLALVLGMALGAALGGFNGLLVTRGGVPPIIVTLGTLSIYRGLIFLYSGGTWINAYEMPPGFRDVAKGTPFGIPNLIVIALIVAAAVYYFLTYTRTGRDIYAVGSNPDAARFAGIPKERIIFQVFMISGLLCGLAGVLWASRFESAQTNTAMGFELQTVAAPVVGGVNIFGGSGSVLGVILGAFLLGIINNALTLIGISPFWQLAVQGLLILLAVITDSVVSRRLRGFVGRRSR